MLAMSSYAASTEIIPGATGTSTPDGPVDLFLPMPRLDNPLCADSPLEWVPDHEKATVPVEVAELCLACDVREKCLLWACLTQTPRVLGRDHQPGPQRGRQRRYQAPPGEPHRRCESDPSPRCGQRPEVPGRLHL